MQETLLYHLINALLGAICLALFTCCIFFDVWTGAPLGIFFIFPLAPFVALLVARIIEHKELGQTSPNNIK